MVDYLFDVFFQFLYQFRVCNPYRLTAFYILTVYVFCGHRKHILKEKYRFTVKDFHDLNRVCRLVLFLLFQYQVLKLFCF